MENKMDSDANYREICELFRELSDMENICLSEEKRERFQELWEALFQWLKRGGFSPMNIPGVLPQFIGEKFAALALEWHPGKFCIHFIKPGSKSQKVFYLR